ncbi:MAG: Cna B-type domain-containing protein [Clostridia bacterium]|nr:Cna B-type domain-containing protein [Clostridia bacterium]
MKERLWRIVSVLCVLAMALGCLACGAAEQQNYGFVTINWQDENNADGIRPASVTIGGAILTAENGWTGIGNVPVTGTPDLEHYSVGTISVNGDITTVTYVHRVEKRNVTPQVVWQDENNAKGIRPSSLPIRVLQNGNPYTAELKVGASNGWRLELSLPENLYGRMESAAYAISAPDVAGYKKDRNGVAMIYTLETGKLSLDASVSGAPEGTDLSGLQVRVTGPDKTMPRTLTWGQISAGPVDLGDVIPGTYLVEDLNADTLVKDYVLSGSASRVADAVQVKAGEAAALRFTYVYTPAVAVDPANTPDPAANQGNLRFEILGPDPRMPITVPFSDFVNGQYEIADLVPGSYTVVERNAETLVDTYTLRSDSVTGMHLAVTAGGTATATLYNHYTPAPTPKPDAENVDVPVIKTWNDSDNEDGNRPAQITVRLYADGVQVDSVALSAANSWRYTFTELPRYTEAGAEIAYTVTEDPVAQYRTTIRGYSVVNDYEPNLVSASVSKRWIDDNNAAGLRPTSIAMSLSNGSEVVAVAVLNDSNGWSATINNLPATRNGEAVTYVWTEQQTIGYTQTGAEVDGNDATFTNALYQRPEVEAANLPARRPGDTFYIFEDYETPLGVEIMINHVGDCFD